MSLQKVKQKIGLAVMRDNERNRSALARVRAQMAMSGQARLDRQVDQIVQLTTGVRP